MLKIQLLVLVFGDSSVSLYKFNFEWKEEKKMYNLIEIL